MAGAESLFGKRFYEGGFEDKMTRREAALILGVRESAAPQRIKVYPQREGIREDDENDAEACASLLSI